MIPNGEYAVDGLPPAVTVSAAFPEIVPNDAVMMVDPVPTEADKPASLMVATAVSEELQVTDEVKSCAEPSE